MKIRILKGTNTIGGAITEITSKQAKIILDFRYRFRRHSKITCNRGLNSRETKLQCRFYKSFSF